MRGLVRAHHDRSLAWLETGRRRHHFDRHGSAPRSSTDGDATVANLQVCYRRRRPGGRTIVEFDLLQERRLLRVVRDLDGRADKSEVGAPTGRELWFMGLCIPIVDSSNPARTSNHSESDEVVCRSYDDAILVDDRSSHKACVVPVEQQCRAGASQRAGHVNRAAHSSWWLRGDERVVRQRRSAGGPPAHRRQVSRGEAVQLECRESARHARLRADVRSVEIPAPRPQSAVLGNRS
jgi:hypothetical protein